MLPYSSTSCISGAFGKVDCMPSCNGTAEDEGEDLWTCLPSSMVCGLDGNDSEDSPAKDDSGQVCAKEWGQVQRGDHPLRDGAGEGRAERFEWLHANAATFFFGPLLIQVRTLFISGLPMDVRPRELYLLFRPFPVSFLTDYLTHGECWVILKILTDDILTRYYLK